MFNNVKNEILIFGMETMYSLVYLIYDRISKISSYSFKSSNLGKIVSLVSSDFSTVLNKLSNLFAGFFAPLEVIACSVMIIIKFRWTGVLVITAILLVIPLSMLMVKISVKIREGVNIQKDERIIRTAELISGIKYIKLYNWQ